MVHTSDQKGLALTGPIIQERLISIILGMMMQVGETEQDLIGCKKLYVLMRTEMEVSGNYTRNFSVEDTANVAEKITAFSKMLISLGKYHLFNQKFCYLKQPQPPLVRI